MSCKDDNDGETAPYDPGTPIEITDFTPKEGGAKTRVIINGSNFGTDTSIIDVTIGGKKAPVINAKGNSIYCMIPGKVKEGNLILTIGKGSDAQTLEAKDKFTYVRKILVSTLYGKEREDGHYEPMDGSFAESFNIMVWQNQLGFHLTLKIIQTPCTWLRITVNHCAFLI